MSNKQENPPPQGGMPSKRPPAAVFIWLLVLVMIVTLFIYKFTPSLANSKDLSQSEFESWLSKGWIKTAVILPETEDVLQIEGVYDKTELAAPVDNKKAEGDKKVYYIGYRQGGIYVSARSASRK